MTTVVARFTATCLAVLLPLTVAQAQDAPAPDLSPAEVVSAQLAGFAQGDAEGIARAFAFASPRNRANTGPLPRFQRMITEGYPELIGHRDAELAPLSRDDRHAYQGVEIVGEDGRSHLYLFILSEYELSDCDGCWLTEGVNKRPADPDEKAL